MSAEPDTQAGAVSADQAEPTPTVSHAEQTASRPPGSAQPEGGVSVAGRPEALVGAAFAGGLALAFVLRRIVG